MPSILHLCTNCNSKIEQTWVISCTEKNTLNAIKANHYLTIISDLIATASSYYGRLYKVLSNNTQQSITATWGDGGGGGGLLKSPPELLTFTDLSFSCYQHNKLIQTTFQNYHRLAVGGMGVEGRKSSMLSGCWWDPALGPEADVEFRGQTGNVYLHSRCRIGHQGFARNLSRIVDHASCREHTAGRAATKGKTIKIMTAHQCML